MMSFCIIDDKRSVSSRISFSCQLILSEIVTPTRLTYHPVAESRATAKLSLSSVSYLHLDISAREGVLTSTSIQRQSEQILHSNVTARHVLCMVHRASDTDWLAINKPLIEVIHKVKARWTLVDLGGDGAPHLLSRPSFSLFLTSPRTVSHA